MSVISVTQGQQLTSFIKIMRIIWKRVILSFVLGTSNSRFALLYGFDIDFMYTLSVWSLSLFLFLLSSIVDKSDKIDTTLCIGSIRKTRVGSKQKSLEHTPCGVHNDMDHLPIHPTKYLKENTMNKDHQMINLAYCFLECHNEWIWWI